MIPAVGMLITPNVRLTRPLGSGGMGSVWVAQHLTLDIEVAVKFIADDEEARDRLVARFRREASLAARIGNPHVVKIFDHGVSEEGTPYIVMELLSGESLADRLARTERLTPREVVLLVSQVARVLTEAHALGIVHRDLKPNNLFLIESGYQLFVKVLDFGIAKSGAPNEPSSLTESGAVVGTPHYMSPEALVSSRDTDQRADLWALSVVAYRALTGALPFEGESFAALTIAIHEGRFPPPSSLVKSLTPDIDAWFKVALCRKPALRHASAAELSRSFRRACAALVSLSGELDEEELPQSAPVPAPVASTPAASTLAGTSGDALRPPRRWRFAVGTAVLVAAGAVWAMTRSNEAVNSGTGDGVAPSAAQKTAPEPAPTSQPMASPTQEPKEQPAERSTGEPVRPPPRPAPPHLRRAAPTSTAEASAVPKASSTTALPEHCKEPFTIDEHGDLVPRPECFRK
jgi:serine/threonine-protein kinase